MPAIEARGLVCEPYAYSEARAVSDALGVLEPVAITLVRRGYRTPEAAREFLDGSEAHDPLGFDSMADITARLLVAAEGAERITVHGDYDVDGVCSTAILVRALREAGASCDWFIPDRASDGYGLTLGTVETLAARGTELILTADCGIACAEEVEAARRAGIAVIVTDHHSAPENLPACPILHPSVSGYPFEELCATAVAHKLALALRREAGLTETGLEDLPLVALATVADMVPLVGENRRLVREGLAEARRAPGPGLRALIAVSRSDPARLDAGDLGFRLAPRINAAGRLYRADAGVELMLTADGARAAEIATELDRANFERRTIEREALDAAEFELASLDPALREAPSIVLAGRGWHPGVIGIVASRLVERHAKPVVLIALDGAEATGRGSGRSIPGFDLVEAMAACEEHLTRFGGHAAAAGLEIEAGAVDRFRDAFLAYSAETISPEQLVLRDRLDASVGVGVEGIGLELAEQIERLGPFGSGNPEPSLLIPAAWIREVRALGESGDHARFQLESGTGRALGVAFNAGAELRGLEDRQADLLVRLEVDHWNGAVEPRVVLGRSHLLSGQDEADARPGCTTPAAEPEWWRRFEAELRASLTEWPGGAILDAVTRARARSERELVDRRGGALVAALTELVSGGGSVLALCADAARRRSLAERSADPARLGRERASVACARCGEAGAREALERAASAGGLALADWGALALAPDIASRFAHLVLVEPPPFEHLERLAAAAAGGERDGATPLHRGFLHLAWGESELRVAERLLEHEWELRPQVTELYRALAAPGALSGSELAAVLAGEGPYPRPPELAARCARVLIELELCEWVPDPGGGTLRVVSSKVTDLQRSEAYLAYRAKREEGKRYLRRREQLQSGKALPAAA